VADNNAFSCLIALLWGAQTYKTDAVPLVGLFDNLSAWFGYKTKSLDFKRI